MSDNIYIGHVAKTHGLHGLFSVKLIGTKEFCEFCKKIRTIYTDDNFALNIQKTEINSNIFLKIKTKEINNKEEAKLILRKEIYIKKGEVLEIDELLEEQNRFINFQVINKEQKEIGIIKKIDYNRTQPIMMIKTKQDTILAPYIENFILEKDIKNKQIIVDFPDGLIETCAFND
jgi:16S rRNA processing protein RimM